jgi:hypothetical protein
LRGPDAPPPTDPRPAAPRSPPGRSAVPPAKHAQASRETPLRLAPGQRAPLVRRDAGPPHGLGDHDRLATRQRAQHPTGSKPSQRTNENVRVHNLSRSALSSVTPSGKQWLHQPRDGQSVANGVRGRILANHARPSYRLCGTTTRASGAISPQASTRRRELCLERSQRMLKGCRNGHELRVRGGMFPARRPGHLNPNPCTWTTVVALTVSRESEIRHGPTVRHHAHLLSRSLRPPAGSR